MDNHERVALDQASVSAAYSRLSAYYDIVFDRVFDGGRRQLYDLLQRDRPLKILEVGIGTGLSLPYYSRNWKVMGIDLSWEMLQGARQKKDRNGCARVHLAQMDATRLALPDRSFDAVVAAYVISAVPDPVGVIREMQRVCKPGGDIVFLNHFHSEHRGVAWFERKINPWCARWGFRTDLELPPLVRETRLDVRSTYKVNLFRLWRLVHCRNRNESGAAGNGHPQVRSSSMR